MSHGYTKKIPIDTDITLSANTDLLVPSQRAIKTYVDNIVYSGGGRTYVQPGTNITTGGTIFSPVINVVASPSFTDVYATTISGVSISATTLYSGTSELGGLLAQFYAPISVQNQWVQPGLNITTGGTANAPIVNLAGTISLTGVTATSVSGTSVSATTFYSGTTPLNSILSAYAPKDLSINRNSGTYILALTDDSKTILLSSATAQNCVVPRNAAVAFPIGAQVMVVQTGAGQVTFSADTGVSLLSYTSLIKLSGQYAGASLIKTDTNEWSLVGNLTS